LALTLDCQLMAAIPFLKAGSRPGNKAGSRPDNKADNL
jgi:hypothetical protein